MLKRAARRELRTLGLVHFSQPATNNVFGVSFIRLAASFSIQGLKPQRRLGPAQLKSLDGCISVVFLMRLLNQAPHCE